MAWTQADLDALDKAIGEGVVSVAYRDRSVVYRSLDEMLRTRAMMDAEINPPVAGTDRVQRVNYDKGYQ